MFKHLALGLFFLSAPSALADNPPLAGNEVIQTIGSPRNTLLVSDIASFVLANMPITPPFSGGTVPGQVGSNTSLRVTLTPATDWVMGTKSGALIPVALIQPGPLATPNQNFAVDIMPTGGTPVDGGFPAQGNVWTDTCNSDFNVVLNLACTHVATSNNGDAVFGNSQYGSASRGRILFPTSIASPISEQTLIDGQDQLFTRGMLVGGTGSTIGSGPTTEDASTNLLTFSQTPAASGFTLTSVTSVASTAESPDGLQNAALATITANSGNLAQTYTAAADTASYTFSAYVSQAGASSLFTLIINMSGGTAVNTGVNINPANGNLTTIATVPIAYGAQKIIVGCTVGCIGQPAVWWRLWLTIANNNDTTIAAKIYPAGTSQGAGGTSIIFGAQLEKSATLSSYVPTTGASAVTRPIGTSITPINASSLLNYGKNTVLGVIKTTPASGATVSFAATQQEALIVPAGALAALTVTLPACAAANDGDERKFIVSQAITALTVGASAGSVVGGATSATAGVGHGYHCYGADTAWYQMN